MDTQKPGYKTTEFCWPFPLFCLVLFSALVLFRLRTLGSSGRSYGDRLRCYTGARLTLKRGGNGSEKA